MAGHRLCFRPFGVLSRPAVTGNLFKALSEIQSVQVMTGADIQASKTEPHF